MQSSTLASLGLAIGGVLWGLFWLPIREISGFGITGAWPGTLLYGLTLIALLPVAFVRRRSMVRRWRRLLLVGGLTGAAFSLYASSLLLTDVVRVLLLFYLSPLWATLLGALFLGERLTLSRLAALGLGAAGLLVVLGLGDGWPLPRNAGDWMALLSGLAWAFGSMKLYQMGGAAVSEQIIAFVAGGLVVGLITIWLTPGGLGGTIAPGAIRAATGWLFLSLLLVLPMLFLTIWPAGLLSPGRVGLLLMTEVAVGVGSAAWLTDEPFGMREATGCALILGAGLVELVGPRWGKARL